MASSSVLRTLASQSRVVISRRALLRQQTRAFHSPFAVLNTPLESPPHSSSNVSPIFYEKQDAHVEPPTGTVFSQNRTYYVVSEPDPSHTPYEVPAGAYPTSAPYHNYPTASNTEGVSPSRSQPPSSTSSSFAHPYVTREVPQNESGVKASSAVRFREAPGEMGTRGGSYGGLGLMDKSTTTKGPLGEFASRNPQPDHSDAVRKNSRMKN